MTSGNFRGSQFSIPKKLIVVRLKEEVWVFRGRITVYFFIAFLRSFSRKRVQIWFSRFYDFMLFIPPRIIAKNQELELRIFQPKMKIFNIWDSGFKGLAFSFPLE